MKILKAIGVAVLAVATCFSARAEVVTNDLVNAAGTVIGYEITGLGTAGDEVALVFTDTSEDGHTWQVPAGVTSFEYLVVAGGGGGGNGTNSGNQQAGGGGAGGYLSGNATDIASGSLVKILVGPGGPAKTSGTASSLLFGETEIKAIGGGRGGSAARGASGGSGGGGGHTKAGGSGTEGQGYAGGNPDSNGNSGGGGGAGGPGYTPNKSENQGGDGGPGLQNDITGTAVWYAAGGGGSSRQNGSAISGAGGLGGGGKGGASSKSGGNATSWGSGGGGACGSGKTGGSGYQGVVVIRYTAVENLVLVPEIESKAYNGERQYSGLVETDDYTVADEGGIEAGQHPVVLTLKDSSNQWDMENSVNPLTLYFEITQAENSWTAAPSITISEWFKGAAEIGSITPATTQFGNVTVTITKDGQPFTGDYTNLSTFEAGSYVVTFTAPAECSSYTAITDEPARTVEFIVYAADEVPEYTLTLGEMTVNADRSVSVPYTLACEVATEYTANIYAAYAIEGTYTTNTYALATGVALTCSGTGSIPDLKPGVNYSVSFYAMVKDEQSEPTTPVIIAIPGAASDLTASATFTNDPMKFIVSGSVVPGIGTTTVTVNWAINDTETLNNTTNFVFQYGDKGTFNFEIPYTSFDDKLTYNVTVQNTVDASTHGNDFTWNSSLDATTKSRADAANITYTWTGEGGDNLWTNIVNWTTSATENFGYPNSKYARASFTSAPINGVNLDGKTITLRAGGNGLAFSENLGEVVFTNGKFAFASGGENDYAFGASGTTVVFDSVNITSGMRGLKFKSNSPTVFSGDSYQSWLYEPWGIDNTRLIVRNGTMSSGYFQVWWDSERSHDVVVSNAVWTIRDSNGAHKLGMVAYFRDGEDYQGRVISKCDNGFSLQYTYDIEIPESGHEYATITAIAAESKSPYCNIRLDVSEYKSGKPVPLVRYTSSTDQALSTNKINLVAYTNGVDGAVNVTADRNAKLVWSSEDNTLYYEQDGEGVAMIGEEIYETLQDAVDAAATTGDTTITLIDDVDLTTHVVVGKTVTLDLNGYTIGNTVAMWDHLVVAENRGDCNIVSMIRVVGGTLTITDSSDAKTGTVSALENDCFCIHADGGDLVINDGTFVGNVTCIQVDSESIATINGGEFKILQLDTDIPYGYLLNCIDNSGSSIIVNAGTFYGFDPANNSAEGANTDFCAAAAYSYLAETVDGVSVYVVAPAVAKIGNVKYPTLEAALAAASDGNTITLIDDVDLTTHVVVGKTVTLDLNGYTIGNTVPMWDHLVVAENRGDCNIVSMIRVVGGTLTITDSSDAKTGTVSALENDCFCIHADGGDLVINDGTFVGNVTCIQVDSESIATINGGEFKILQLDTDIPYGYLLNCIDNSGSSIIVNAGTFYGFDPANNSAEGANTDFCAAAAYSYLAETTADGVSVYVVASAVASIGNVKYATFAAAFAAAQTGNTIKLLDDCTVSGEGTFFGLAAGVSLTIDLNGKTLTESVNPGASDYGAFYVRKGSTLTITDTTEAKNGKIASNGDIVIGNYGTVIVEAGTIEAGDEANSDTSIYNMYWGTDYYGTTTVNGGKIGRIWNSGVANVTAGEIVDIDNSGAMTIASGVTISGDIVLKDGSDAAEVPGKGILTAPANLNVTAGVEGYTVQYADGAHKLVKAAIDVTIGETEFETVDALLAAANSGTTMTVPASETVTWSAEGNVLKKNDETYATFATYYDVTVDGTSVTLSLVDEVVPEIAESEAGAGDAFVMTDKTVTIKISNAVQGLYYGIQQYSDAACSTKVGEATLTAAGEGSTLALSVSKPTVDAAFFRVVVTDIAPASDGDGGTN